MVSPDFADFVPGFPGLPDGLVDFADVNPFVALLAGGGNAALAQTLTWDAENRLVRVEPTPGQYSPPPDGAQKVEFGYDYLGRRVLKKVWTWQAGSPGSWVLTDVRKFVWSGWLMLLELEGGTGVPPVDTVMRKYTWGLDLAGLSGDPSRDRQGAGLEGAGGIGGLLAVQAPGAGPGGGDLNAVYTYCE